MQVEALAHKTLIDLLFLVAIWHAAGHGMQSTYFDAVVPFYRKIVKTLPRHAHALAVLDDEALLLKFEMLLKERLISYSGARYARIHHLDSMIPLCVRPMMYKAALTAT